MKIQNQLFWSVYLLRCSDGKIYTGCTSNLNKRLLAHQSGKVSFTKSRLPFELVTFISFNDRRKAFKFEKYLKSGSGKAFSQKRFV